MTDKYESKAREFVATHESSDEAVVVRELAAALRSARAEALEEAAKIAETTPDSGIPTMDDVERFHAHKIASAIRSLKVP